MARARRLDLVTPALVALIGLLLVAWWWALGGRPPDLAMAPAQATAAPQEGPKRAAPRVRPPEPVETVRGPPQPMDPRDAERFDGFVERLSAIEEDAVFCRLLYAELNPAFAMMYRDGEFLGTALIAGEHLLFTFVDEPTAGPVSLEIYQDGRTVSVDLVGDPLRCDPDPVVLPEATDLTQVVLVVRNAGEAGQTTATGCGASGRSDASGRITLIVYGGHLDAGCTVSVTRQDGLLDVPGAEIELGPEDAGAEIPVELPERATGGLGVSLEIQGDAVVLLEVFPDTPGASAGLRSGDRLLSADGQALPADLDAVRSLLTGPEGSDVELEVENDDGVRIVRVTRAVLPG